MSISQHQNNPDSPFYRVPKEHRQEWRDFMEKQIQLSEYDTRWQGMCESLQRQAHGFDAAFASAYAHMIATPASERIDPREAPVGAFIFCDDPNDSNRYGHVVGKWSREHDDDVESIPVVTNDVNDSETGYDPGNVTVVPLGWFPRYWGDSIKFATLWFGGDEIPTFTPESGKEDTAEWIHKAIDRAHGVIEMMRKALRDNDEEAHPSHERAITREINAQRKIIEDLRKQLP